MDERAKPMYIIETWMGMEGKGCPSWQWAHLDIMTSTVTLGQRQKQGMSSRSWDILEAFKSITPQLARS